MTLRVGLRRSLPYAVAVIGGFLFAYLLVAFMIFPSGVVTGDAHVPSVTGLGYDEAVKRLGEVGLKARRGSGRVNGTTPKGVVLEQDPAAGTRAKEGETVTLSVSAGQQVVAVPSVVGLTQADAESALEAAGFDLGQVVQRENSGPPGQVLESTPPSGVRVAIPSSVSLVVSVGSAVALVPNVVGRSVGDARDVLESAGLALGQVSAPTPEVSDGELVTGQNPAAGSHVPTGTKITLQVGSTTAGGRP